MEWYNIFKNIGLIYILQKILINIFYKKSVDKYILFYNKKKEQIVKQSKKHFKELYNIIFYIQNILPHLLALNCAKV